MKTEYHVEATPFGMFDLYATNAPHSVSKQHLGSFSNRATALQVRVALEEYDDRRAAARSTQSTQSEHPASITIAPKPEESAEAFVRAQEAEVSSAYTAVKDALACGIGWLETKHIKVENTLDGILNERGSRYGKFKDHAAVTQQLKQVMFGFKPDLRLDSDQREALEMIAHKIGRIVNGDPNYADSWDDLAGYAKLIGDRLAGVER